MTEVTSDAAGSDSQLLEAENVQSASGAALAGDPVVLGLLVFALGATVLGISLIGYVPAAIQGASIMPIVYAATGLGLLVTTVWASALGQTFVATVLGAFACFWISYAAMVLGLNTGDEVIACFAAHPWAGSKKERIHLFRGFFEAL